MSSTQQERELSRRLDKIESQNRIFKVYAGFITLLFMAVLFMGNTAVLQNGRFKNITAQGLTIVDSGGEKLIFIGKAADGTGLEVFNKNNKRVFGLGINKDDYDQLNEVAGWLIHISKLLDSDEKPSRTGDEVEKERVEYLDQLLEQTKDKTVSAHFSCVTAVFIEPD